MQQPFPSCPSAALLPNFADMIATELEPPRRARHRKQKSRLRLNPVQTSVLPWLPFESHSSVAVPGPSTEKVLKLQPFRSPVLPQRQEQEGNFVERTTLETPFCCQQTSLLSVLRKFERIFPTAPPLQRHASVWVPLLCNMVYELWDDVVADTHFTDIVSSASLLHILRDYFLYWLFDCIFHTQNYCSVSSLLEKVVSQTPVRRTLLGSDRQNNEQLDSVSTSGSAANFTQTLPTSDHRLNEQPWSVMLCNPAFYVWIWKLWLFTRAQSTATDYGANECSLQEMMNNRYYHRCSETVVSEVTACESMKVFLKDCYARFLDLYGNLLFNGCNNFRKPQNLLANSFTTPLTQFVLEPSSLPTTQCMAWNTSKWVTNTLLQFDPILLETSYSACQTRSRLRETVALDIGINAFTVFSPCISDIVCPVTLGFHFYPSTTATSNISASATSHNSQTIQGQKRPLQCIAHNVDFEAQLLAYTVVSEIVKHSHLWSGGEKTQFYSLKPFSNPFLVNERSPSTKSYWRPLSTFMWPRLTDAKELLVEWLSNTTITMLQANYFFYWQDPECKYKNNINGTFSSRTQSSLRLHQIKCFQSRKYANSAFFEQAKRFKTWDVIINLSKTPQHFDAAEKQIATKGAGATQLISANAPESSNSYFHTTSTTVEFVVTYFPPYHTRSYFGDAQCETVPLLELTLDDQPELLAQIWNQLLLYYSQIFLALPNSG